MSSASVYPSTPTPFEQQCIDSGFTPEQIRSIQEDLVDPFAPPNFNSKTARRLFALGLETAARRVEACGCYWRYYFCDGPTGHIYRQNTSRCMTHFACGRCALRYAEDTLNKFSPIGELLVGQFTYLRITFPSHTSATDLKSAADKAGRVMQSAKAKADFAMVKFLVNYQGTSRGTAELRILYSGPKDPTTTLRNLWPEAQFSGELCSRDSFQTVLRLLLEPGLPANPETRAELEAKFKGMRTLRTWGTLTKNETYLYKSTTYTNNSLIHPASACETTISDPSIPCKCCGKPTLRKVPKCPTCGALPKLISSWVRCDNPRETPKNIPWIESKIGQNHKMRV